MDEFMLHHKSGRDGGRGGGVERVVVVVYFL